MDRVVLNFEKLLRVLSTLKRNQKDRIALMHSEKCKTVSGNFVISDNADFQSSSRNL
jgi:hypothetical protein